MLCRFSTATTAPIVATAMQESAAPSVVAFFKYLNRDITISPPVEFLMMESLHQLSSSLSKIQAICRAVNWTWVESLDCAGMSRFCCRAAFELDPPLQLSRQQSLDLSGSCTVR